jgi:hypothetical protein
MASSTAGEEALATVSADARERACQQLLAVVVTSLLKAATDAHRLKVKPTAAASHLEAALFKECSSVPRLYKAALRLCVATFHPGQQRLVAGLRDAIASDPDLGWAPLSCALRSVCSQQNEQAAKQQQCSGHDAASPFTDRAAFAAALWRQFQQHRDRLAEKRRKRALEVEEQEAAQRAAHASKKKKTGGGQKAGRSPAAAAAKTVLQVHANSEADEHELMAARANVQTTLDGFTVQKQAFHKPQQAGRPEEQEQTEAAAAAAAAAVLRNRRR